MPKQLALGSDHDPPAVACAAGRPGGAAVPSGRGAATSHTQAACARDSRSGTPDIGQLKPYIALVFAERVACESQVGATAVQSEIDKYIGSAAQWADQMVLFSKGNQDILDFIT